MRHTITIKDIETIQEVAGLLPPIKRHVRRALRGKALIELGYIDWHGERIDADAQYAVDEIVQVNLVRVITRIAEEEGMHVVHQALDHLRNSASYIDFAGRLVFVNTNRIRTAAN